MLREKKKYREILSKISALDNTRPCMILPAQSYSTCLSLCPRRSSLGISSSVAAFPYFSILVSTSPWGSYNSCTVIQLEMEQPTCGYLGLFQRSPKHEYWVQRWTKKMEQSCPIRTSDTNAVDRSMTWELLQRPND